jgi:hypothetical protein
LVYPVATSCHVPALCFTRKLGGRKSLTFEALFVGCFCQVLLDSGATNSFVSLSYMIDNGISFAPIQVPDATPADGFPIPIVGIARNMRMSFGPFRFTETFLVVDMSNLDVVLGSTFLERYNPRIDWQQ